MLATPAGRRDEVDTHRQRDSAQHGGSRRFLRRVLIGLTRDALKATCGLAHRINVTATARGVREQWIYQ
jgi:hypothetical protein